MPKYKLTKPGRREITLARTFDAPRRLVFDAFIKPEMVKEWPWGPSPEWPMVLCEIDLRVGGLLRYVWRHKSTREMGMSGVFRDIKVPELLVNTELFDEDWTGGETRWSRPPSRNRAGAPSFQPRCSIPRRRPATAPSRPA